MAFKLKSGNKSPFKNMGSSPAKREFDDASGYNDAMRDFAEEMKPNQKKRFLEDSDVSPAKNQAILDAAADLKDDLKESPAKHGTTDDFLYGKNGHNPDTMEGKHEDWHTDKIEAEKKKPSPAKQEGPIDEKQLKLQPSENPDTYVYKSSKKAKDKKFNRSERIGGLEDRISFIDETANSEGRSINGQEKKDKAKLNQELAILRKSKHK